MLEGEYLYHATSMTNLVSILDNGLTKGVDGIVYLADSPENALKFVAIRGVPEILVIRVKKAELKQEQIIKTFDHSERFFQCRSWGYAGNISADLLDNFTKYENNLRMK